MSDRIFTVPNALSLVRLALVPVFLTLLVLGFDALALVVLAVSTVTDYLDGLIARRFNQITRLGQILDPAADRLFIVAAVIGLAVRGIVPIWLVVVLVGRDIVIVALGIVLARYGYGPLRVHHLGKVATFCLFLGLPVLVLGEAFPAVAGLSAPVGWALVLWGAFLYWWAAAVYAAETLRVIRIPLPPAERSSDTLDG